MADRLLAEPPAVVRDPALRAFEHQRRASRTQAPLGLAQRLDALDALLDAILANEAVLVAALKDDFGNRSAHETRILELFPLVDEIWHVRRHLRRWMRRRRVGVNWQFWPSRARIVYQPLGVVGVIGAWNYPILLALSPLVNALAAGNRVMLKPSEGAPATAEAIRGMIVDVFPEEYVSVVIGGAEVSAAFAALPFDHLIFTGSERIGRMVMQAAAANLTPVTLELGGKSPAIVHASYPMPVAADRICAAKFWNAGQTCVAPDYALVPAGQEEAFVRDARVSIEKRFGAAAGNDVTHMINATAWQRMQALVEDARSQGARIIQVASASAQSAAGAGTFTPTLILGATMSMRVMQEEIFGPILPVVPYASLDAAIAYVNERPRPLALYYFDQDRNRIDEVLERTISGGVTVNDCMFHLPQHGLPFGGVGPSGMGAYHGFDGFETFSKKKGVLLQSGLVASLLGRFVKPPYGPWTDRLLALLIRRGKRRVGASVPAPPSVGK